MKEQEKTNGELSAFFKDNQSPCFAKIGIYGAAGTGKTFSATQIAVGLWKKYKLDKPVLFYDSEKGSDYVRGIFEKEGIPFKVKKSRTFKDLMLSVQLAEKEGSILIIDSITHVWRELMQAYLNQFNKERYDKLVSKVGKARADEQFRKSIQLEFQHWNVIKPLWAKFTDAYLNSNLHMVVCGRAGDIYDYQENENGRKELIKSGTRMATEKELSYEPSLLIALERRSVNGENKLVAYIEKDRSNTINEKEFEYLKFEDILPHFEFLDIGGKETQINMNANDSANLFENQTMNPEDEWAIEKRKRTELAEEIKGLMMLKIPGMTGPEKQQRLELYQKHFQTVSETKIENTHSETLQKGLVTLREALKEL